MRKTRLLMFLKSLRKKKQNSENKYEDLYPVGTSPGILYGCAKTHKTFKDGVPHFRPILPTIGTPRYKISKLFVPLLTPLTLMNIQSQIPFCFPKRF